MNIHISKEEHNYLQNKILYRVTIGSRLYGTETPTSDTDILCIYDGGFLKTQIRPHGLPNIHQFQYKDLENNIDYIYTTIDQFFHNLQSGDSSINADVLLLDTAFPYVAGRSNAYDLCRTYKVIKGYIGFAKRDLKHYKEGIHKIRHAHRSLYMAEQLMQNKIPYLCDIQRIYEYPYDRDKLIDIEKQLRKELNNMFESNQIHLYYIEDITENTPGKTLTQKLFESNNIREFRY